MNVLSYPDTSASLDAVMDRVVSDHVPVVLARRRAESVVMISLADWRTIAETLHLDSSPGNAARLDEAIAQLDAGGGTERELPDA